MKTIKQVVKGLGSTIFKTHDREKIIQNAMDRLSRNQGALEFINSSGWHTMMAEYDVLLASMEEHLRGQCRNAKINQDEIQKTSDFIDCFRTVINMTNKIVAIHNQATQTIKQNEETAQGTGVRRP